MARRLQPFSMEIFFRALADRTRLRLLSLMGEREVCVCYFVEVFRTYQPKISRHLAYLRKAGIVAARREGKWMHYRVIVPRDPHAAQVLRATMQWLAEDPEVVRDRERLTNVCCTPQRLVRLHGAPLPAMPAEARQ